MNFPINEESGRLWHVYGARPGIDPVDSAAGSNTRPEPSGLDNSEFFKYRPAKTNKIITMAEITKIDSRIVKAKIFVFFMISSRTSSENP